MSDRSRKTFVHVVVAYAITLVALCGLAMPAGAAATAPTYDVVLGEDVAIDSHLKGLRINAKRVFESSPHGYSASLNASQYQRVLSSADVLIISSDVERTAGFEPSTQTGEAPQPPQSPSLGVRRIGGLLSPTAAIDGIDSRVDVDVAVIDSGIDAAHPDLNVAGTIDCSGNNGTDDKNGHGTMVAGFVGAIDNAIGRVGVAPGARIWAIQVANNKGNITDGALLCAIDWVTAHASTIEVANLSLAGPGADTGNCGIAARKQDGDPVHAAICDSVASGVTFVVAAGNDSTDTARVTPAAYDEVITVSALADSDGVAGGQGPALPCVPGMADDTLAIFSNYGADVDLAAPGVCLGSTYPGGTYAIASGTSFSAPLVTGAAALYRSTHPYASPAGVQSALLAAQEPGPIQGDPDAYAEGVVNVSTL